MYKDIPVLFMRDI